MRKALVVLAVLVALAGGSIAYASIPDSSGVIHACYGGDAMKNGLSYGTGTLRVIDTEAGQSCATNETPLTWNQTGPQGPQGPKGDTGAVGPQGPQGAAGPSFTAQTVRVEAYSNPDGEGYAWCPSGYVITGGGFAMDLVSNQIPQVSEPDPGGGNGWYVVTTYPPEDQYFHNPNPSFQIYAECLKSS